MPRVSRMIVKEKVAVYHVMSRTALDGFPLQAYEKDYLVELIKRMANLFFTEIFGFSVLGNHFHALVKMIPEHHYTDEEVKARLVQFYGEKKAPVGEAQLPIIRQKLSSLSEFVREVKVNFSRFYNKRHGRTYISHESIFFPELILRSCRAANHKKKSQENCKLFGTRAKLSGICIIMRLHIQ